MRFHLGTSKAPTAWTVSRVGTGSHSCGRGLKLSFRSRVEASELRLDRWSCRTVKVSSEETRFSDMMGCQRQVWQESDRTKKHQEPLGGWARDGRGLSSGPRTQDPAGWKVHQRLVGWLGGGCLLACTAPGSSMACTSKPRLVLLEGWPHPALIARAPESVG